MPRCRQLSEKRFLHLGTADNALALRRQQMVDTNGAGEGKEAVGPAATPGAAPPAKGDEAAGSARAGAIDLPQMPAWTTPVFISGIIVGLILVATGVCLEWLALVPSRVATLIVCCGLGIVLGAFGSAAVLRYQGLVIAGVATIAIALFLLLAQNMDNHLKISLTNVPEGMQATLFIDHEIPGARSFRNQYDFYILEQEVDAETVKLDLSGGATEILFDCIPVKLVRPYLGSGKSVQWHLSKDQSEIRVADTRVPLGCEPEDSGFAMSDALRPLALVGEAVAQVPQQSIETFLLDLGNDDPSLRRTARTGLAAWGMVAVRPLMDLWAADPTDYRNALGASVALAEFLRDSKDQRKAVSELLTEQDLALLVDAIGNEDRTLRIYAGEFLYDLGDPRVVTPILERFPSASDDGQFNSLFVLTNVVPDLSPEERQALATRLREITSPIALGPKAQEQLTGLLAALAG